MAEEIIYNPTELYGVVKTVPPAVGALRKLFKDDIAFWHSTKDFLVDFVNKTPGISLYVGDNGDYKLVADKGYTTNRYLPAGIKEKMVITPDDLAKRQPGSNNILGKQSYGSARDFVVGDHSATLRDRKDRLEEQQCSQALLTGTISIVGEGVNRIVDFGLDASHVITPSTLWTDYANATPLYDLEDGITVIEGGGSGTNVVNYFGLNAWRNFEKCAQVQSDLDNRRINKGEIAPKERQAEGLQYRGNFSGIGECWTYTRTYDDADGTERNFMDSDKVIQVVVDPNFEAHYGPIMDFDAPNQTNWEADLFLEVVKVDKKTYEVRIESHPLMSPLNTKQWTVLSPV